MAQLIGLTEWKEKEKEKEQEQGWVRLLGFDPLLPQASALVSVNGETSAACCQGRDAFHSPKRPHSVQRELILVSLQAVILIPSTVQSILANLVACFDVACGMA